MGRKSPSLIFVPCTVPIPRIAIIIDNATWHNELVDETKPPKRSCRNDQLQKWLERHGMIYDTKLKKAELLEIVSANVPPKRYKTNTVANVFNVELVYLPINTYVRSHNTHFRLGDIRSLSEEYIAALDDETSRRFIDHVRKAEEIFRTADDFVEEEIEPYLFSEDELSESDLDINTDDEENVDF